MTEDNFPRYERAEEAGGEPSEPTPPKKQSKNKWIALFVSLGIVALIFAVAFFGLDGSGGVASQRSANNVEVIDIAGTITSSGTSYNQSFIENRIDIAREDPNNAAILLLVDSPGGAVYESDETYLALMDYKEETGRPVYAYCGEYCASGAYYISAAADEIYANRNSMVGSIGIICGQFVDATELLEKIGVDVTTVHSGANKLMGSEYESPTEEQIAIYQTLSDEVYDRFVGIVAESRGMSDEAVRALADGRIYSASQGVANGLIDGISSLEEFEDHLRDELGDISFYHKTYKRAFKDVLTDFVSGAAKKLEASSSELASTLAAIEEMTIDEPMLIYEP